MANARKWGLRVLALVMLLYVFSAVLFTHVHVVGNKIEMHSHPHTPKKHSSTESQPFNMLLSLLVVLVVAAHLNFVFYKLIERRFLFIENLHDLLHEHHYYLRGPPAFPIDRP